MALLECHGATMWPAGDGDDDDDDGRQADASGFVRPTPSATVCARAAWKGGVKALSSRADIHECREEWETVRLPSGEWRARPCGCRLSGECPPACLMAGCGESLFDTAQAAGALRSFTSEKFEL